MSDAIGAMLAQNFAMATVFGSQAAMERAHVALMEYQMLQFKQSIERLKRQTERDHAELQRAIAERDRDIAELRAVTAR